ncbi:hypothetical protein [Nonomuraea sp. NPDC049758]|uniref:hypothetical protein n=1 Tax=Nonomuraea sp. NPDC049758 TaxID=3154360 RepID=UPI003428DD75
MSGVSQAGTTIGCRRKPFVTALVDGWRQLREKDACLRDGDMLTVQAVDRLGRNLLEGLIVLNDLFSAASRPVSTPSAP